MVLLLWHDGATGSVRRLALKAGVPYARAHYELNEMEKVGLAVRERVGGAWVYQPNLNHPRASLLKELVFSEGRADNLTPGEQEILLNLQKLGAPLEMDGQPFLGFPPEEAIARSLPLSHRHEKVARALPFVLWKNRLHLDLRQLEVHARLLGETKALCFFLDVTAVLTGEPRYKEAAKRLRDLRFRKIEPFFVARAGRISARKRRKRPFKLARDWHFKTHLELASFRRLFATEEKRSQ
jgi:hypothetical protein